MDEKKILYNIITDIWNLLKTHMIGKKQLTDDEWQAYVDDVGQKQKKYYSNMEYCILFEQFCDIIEKFMVKKGKDNA